MRHVRHNFWIKRGSFWLYFKHSLILMPGHLRTCTIRNFIVKKKKAVPIHCWFLNGLVLTANKQLCILNYQHLYEFMKQNARWSFTEKLQQNGILWAFNALLFWAPHNIYQKKIISNRSKRQLTIYLLNILLISRVQYKNGLDLNIMYTQSK